MIYGEKEFMCVHCGLTSTQNKIFRFEQIKTAQTEKKILSYH